MAITTQTLYDQKKLQFGTGATPTRFTNDFLQAVTRTLGQMYVHARVDADAPTNIQENIDLDAQSYEWVVSAGVDYHLATLGYSSGGTLGDMKVLWEDALKSAQMREYMDGVEAEDGSVPVKLGDLDDDDTTME